MRLHRNRGYPQAPLAQSTQEAAPGPQPRRCRLFFRHPAVRPVNAAFSYSDALYRSDLLWSGSIVLRSPPWFVVSFDYNAPGPAGQPPTEILRGFCIFPGPVHQKMDAANCQKSPDRATCASGRDTYREIWRWECARPQGRVRGSAL